MKHVKSHHCTATKNMGTVVYTQTVPQCNDGSDFESLQSSSQQAGGPLCMLGVCLELDVQLCFLCFANFFANI